MGALVALFAQGLANQALRGLALKIFLKMLLMTIVPLVILMGFNEILSVVTDYVGGRMDAINPGDGISVAGITGIGAYIFAQLGLQQALSVVIGAFATKLLLRSIPFVRL